MFRKRKNKFKKIKPQNFVYTRVKKRKKRIILTILYILLGVVFAFGLLYFLFFSEYFNIKNISFSGEKTIKEYDLKNTYFEYTGQKKYIFLNQKNILALSSSDLSEALKKSFRRIKNVKIEKNIPNSIDIFIEEYEPVGISCRDFNSAGLDCFYFDKDGIIFDTAPLIIGEMFLSVYDNNLNIENFPNAKYKKDLIDFVLRFKKEILKNSDMSVKYFSFKDQFDDIEVYLKSGFKIFLTKDQNPEKQVYDVMRVIKEEIKENFKDLDYIDLRIKNRAYYKLKTNTPTEEQKMP